MAVSQPAIKTNSLAMSLPYTCLITMGMIVNRIAYNFYQN
uniref:Uncharacterized protein n=1 Tax=Anguilla anguilla TaxID=7936 RepID=A0A0E9PEE4_ANGAN